MSLKMQTRGKYQYCFYEVKTQDNGVFALSLISIYYDFIWSADISNMHTIICIYDLAERQKIILFNQCMINLMGFVNC
jgi:hypothetical protein